ncbi:hypothetical protein [Parazoarcus communis]|nr:hypothetical protein [Parazoarcus communis]|tara:strand:+ start:47028 stop:47153 length:126 start_codon:yes stop_codon:yes gene_type:complete
MHIRLQTIVYLTDLNPDFCDAFADTFMSVGMEAGTCFAIGA